jgi:hypothetical protein
MSSTSTREENLSISGDYRTARRYRSPGRLLFLIVVIGAFAWLCGLPRSVREVQAGGGGTGGGLPACAAGVNNYVYDATGRLSQVQIGCSYLVTYTYDAVGNLLSVSHTP